MVSGSGLWALGSWLLGNLRQNIPEPRAQSPEPQSPEPRAKSPQPRASRSRHQRQPDRERRSVPEAGALDADRSGMDLHDLIDDRQSDIEARGVAARLVGLPVQLEDV